MNEPKTPNLGLNKIDRSSPSTTYFDLDKYLDQNWEKVDEGVGQVEEKAEETAAQVSSIQERLDIEKRRLVTLEPGLQVINAERASAFKLEGLKGRTLVNLLGRDGGFEGYSNWGIGAASATLDTTVYTQGSMSSLKVTLASTNSNISKTVSTSVGKTYILIADVKNVSTSSAFVSISTVVNGNVITGTTFGTSFARFTATASTHAIAVVGGGESGQVFNADNVRLYEVSAAEYAALNSMTPEQVADKYPYVDSVQPVRNPYVIRYGENLLPSFYEAALITKNSKIISPYVYEQTSESTDPWTRILVTICPQTDYHLSFSTLKGKGMLAVFSVDEQTLLLNYSNNGGTFNSGNFTQISVYVNGTGDRADTIINPMLTLGNMPKPFKPREDAMLALQTDLYADPLTETNADEVFEKDGQYFKLKKWQNVVLDGSKLTSSIVGNKAGYKTLYPKLPGIDYNYDSVGEAVAVKYNGKILTWGQHEASADGWAVDRMNSNFAISVSNSDSGWGDSYTPTVEERYAYFMGWTMRNMSASAYNDPTNAAQKTWTPIGYSPPANWNSTWAHLRTSVPVNESSPSIKDGTISSYQLVYQLATPTVEAITSEGKLTLVEGNNQVEVDTGIMLREYTPASENTVNIVGRREINYTSVPHSLLKTKARNILAIYKNGAKDDRWAIGRNVMDAYGTARANLVKDAFDPSATYTVTYFMLDTSPVAQFVGSIAENEKALLTDMNDLMRQNAGAVSVVETAVNEAVRTLLQQQNKRNVWGPIE
ncbi:hypothetical protein MKY87_22125 [Paenibacillus sp. FSL R7-0198]|uniref:hypothetical protein n=1 Tax=Paenibacillus sp. FSL R7-0198 TaxID=2921674 RepID=UPI0030F505F5